MSGDSLSGGEVLFGAGDSQTSAAKPNHHLDAFGAFLLVYPRVKHPEKAKAAWIAAIERGVDPQHMVDRATAYAHERKGEDPKYTPYPATWLNNGGYDDAPDPAHQKRPTGGARSSIPSHDDWTNGTVEVDL